MCANLNALQVSNSTFCVYSMSRTSSATNSSIIKLEKNIIHINQI